MDFTPKEAKDLDLFARFLRTHKEYFLSDCVEPYATKVNGEVHLLLPSSLTWEDDGKRMRYLGGNHQKQLVKDFVRCALPTVSEKKILFTNWDAVMQKRLAKEFLGEPLGDFSPLFENAKSLGRRHTRYIAYYTMQFHKIEHQRLSGGWYKISHAYVDSSLKKELNEGCFATFDNLPKLAAWGTSYQNYEWSAHDAELWFRYKRIKEHPFYTSRYFKIGSMDCGSFEPSAIRELNNGMWQIVWSISSDFGVSFEEKSLLASTVASV